MKKELLDNIEKNMENLFSESYAYGRTLSENDGVRATLNNLSKYLKEIYWDRVYLSVNKASMTPSTYKEKNDNIDLLKNKCFPIITKFKKIIDDNRFKNIDKFINDDLSDYSIISNSVNVIYEEYKKTKINIERKSVEKKVYELVSKYNDLVFDFNRNNGSGFYDFYSSYITENHLAFDSFKSGLELLISKGYDIKILTATKNIESNDKKDKKRGIITILTNSGNIRKIHDVMYQDCNQKNISVDGRLMVPDFGKPLLNDFFENFPQNYQKAYSLSQSFSRSGLPESLKDNYIASIDAFGYTKGHPQAAFITSTFPSGYYDLKNKANCFKHTPNKYYYEKLQNNIVNVDKNVDVITTSVPKNKSKFKLN